MNRRNYTLNRRTVLAGIGTISAAAVGAAVFASQDASAQVTMGELKIPSEEYKDEDGQLYAPWIQIDGNWRYQVSEIPSEWRIYLLVKAKDEDSWSALDLADGDVSSKTGEGTYQVKGKVTSAGSWSASDFTVDEEGDSKTVSLTFGIMFHVRNSSGDVLVEDSIQDTTDLLIQHSKAPTAVGGEGQILFQNDSDSPEP